MRKLVLSFLVIAASGAYVAKTAISSDGGLEALLDRVTFRPAPLELRPLDLDITPADQSDGALAPLILAPQSDLGSSAGNSDITGTLRSGSAENASPPPTLPSPPQPSSTVSIPQAPQSATGLLPPLPRLSPRDSAVARATPPSTSGTEATPNPTLQAVPSPPVASLVPAPEPTSVPRTAGKFRDGAYTGTRADAYYGLVQVRAHVQGGRLTSVEILSYPSDRRTSRSINGYALPLLEREVVRAQEANVDVVSGATLTAVAYERSLDAALKQAE
jgi:uncharacterized protein with FMN-binding domain